MFVFFVICVMFAFSVIYDIFVICVFNLNFGRVKCLNLLQRSVGLISIISLETKKAFSKKYVFIGLLLLLH